MRPAIRFGASATTLMLAMVIGCCLSASAKGSPNIFDDDWLPPTREAPTPVLPSDVESPATQGSSPTPSAPVAPASSGPDQTPVNPGIAPAPIVRSPIPSQPDQAHSRQLLREVFAAQLSDHSTAGRRQLARSLVSESSKTTETPVDQYVLLGGALEAAKQASVLPLCIEAADALGSKYAVDALAVKADAAFATKYNAGTPAENAENIRIALSLIDSLERVEAYSDASRLSSVLLNASKNLAALHSDVEAKVKEINNLRLLREKAVKAAATLKTDPSDAAANLALGSYLCFGTGDWGKGLPFLAQGNDAQIKATALTDLHASSTSAESQIAAGDAWWKTAMKISPQLPLYRRAIAFYHRAIDIGQVTGLSRTRLEERIASVGSGRSVDDAEWLSKDATYVTSSSEPKYPPEKGLLDGRGGDYDTGFAFHTRGGPAEKDPFIVIDLSVPCEITKLEIANRRDQQGERAKTLTVWTSLGGAGPWTEIWRASSVESVWPITPEKLPRCRYVKIGLRGSGVLHLFSVKIYGLKL